MNNSFGSDTYDAEVSVRVIPGLCIYFTLMTAFVVIIVTRYKIQDNFIYPQGGNSKIVVVIKQRQGQMPDMLFRHGLEQDNCVCTQPRGADITRRHIRADNTESRDGGYYVALDAADSMESGLFLIYDTVNREDVQHYINITEETVGNETCSSEGHATDTVFRTEINVIPSRNGDSGTDKNPVLDSSNSVFSRQLKGCSDNNKVQVENQQRSFEDELPYPSHGDLHKCTLCGNVSQGRHTLGVDRGEDHEYMVLSVNFVASRHYELREEDLS